MNKISIPGLEDWASEPEDYTPLPGQKPVIAILENEATRQQAERLFDHDEVTSFSHHDADELLRQSMTRLPDVFLLSTAHPSFTDLLFEIQAYDRFQHSHIIALSETDSAEAILELQLCGVSATITPSTTLLPDFLLQNRIDRARRARFEDFRQARIRSHLEENEARLRTSMAFANIGSWEWDITTDHLLGSERTGPLLGLSPGGVESKLETFLNLVHPDSETAIKEALEKCINENEELQVNFHLKSTGPGRTLQVRGNVVRNSLGKAIRMLGIILEV